MAHTYFYCSSVNGVGEGADHYEETATMESVPVDASGPPDSSDGTDASTIPLEHLKNLLSAQLEYYFSR